LAPSTLFLSWAMKRHYSLCVCFASFLIVLLATVGIVAADDVIRSAKSGPWSVGATWEGGKIPGAGARVLIRPEHNVTYDAESDVLIRAVQIGGTLSFARYCDTLLNVGLLRIAPGDVFNEEGFDCQAHLPKLEPNQPRPALEIGTVERPIPAGKKAIIR